MRKRLVGYLTALTMVTGMLSGCIFVDEGWGGGGYHGGHHHHGYSGGGYYGGGYGYRDRHY